MISAQGFRTLTKKYEYKVFAVYIKDIIKPQVYQATRVSNNKIKLNRVSLEDIEYNRNKKVKPDIDPTVGSTGVQLTVGRYSVLVDIGYGLRS
jgi:hypothetical protein